MTWIKNSLALMIMFAVASAMAVILGVLLSAAYEHAGIIGAVAALAAALAVISMLGGYIITKEYSNEG
jgi:FtsH-binding integral membrane protein